MFGLIHRKISDARDEHLDELENSREDHRGGEDEDPWPELVRTGVTLCTSRKLTHVCSEGM